MGQVGLPSTEEKMRFVLRQRVVAHRRVRHSVDIFKAVGEAAAQHRRRVTTAVMNEVLEDGVRWQKPPSTSTGRQGAIYYCAQVRRQRCDDQWRHVQLCASDGAESTQDRT